MVVRFRRRGPGGHDDVITGSEFERPEALPQSAFHSVSCNRAADSFVDHQSETCRAAVRQNDSQHDQPVAHPPAALTDVKEFGTLSEPGPSLHQGRIQTTSARRRSDGETRTSACAAPTQYPAAADRSHAQSEPVDTETSSFFRLVSTFRHRSANFQIDSKIISGPRGARNEFQSCFLDGLARPS